MCLRARCPWKHPSLVSDPWTRRCAYMLRKPGSKDSEARELLAGEEHEATGDSVGEVDILVVKQLADDRP